MRKMKLFLLLLTVALVFTACSTEEETPEDGTPEEGATADTSDQLYIQVSALGNLDYFYDHQLGMELVGEDLNVQTEYVGPAELDMNAMITAFDQAIAREPNGIVVVGFEDTLVPSINQAIEAGIPVVTVDSDLPESDRIAFVGTGNYEAGYSGGERLAEELDGEGKVAILTKPGQSNLEERIDGYEAALEQYSDIEIVQVADTESDSVVAANAAASVLQRHSDLDAFVAVEAAGGAGAATAVREAGLDGEVKIISMDRDNDTLEYIQDGVITATVAQQTALMPYYAVQILYNLNNSDVPITTDNASAGITGVPGSIDTGVVIVDETNAEYFIRD